MTFPFKAKSDHAIAYVETRAKSLCAALDQRGKGAWIALMVVGFVVAWPAGLGLLLYIIWTGRMGQRPKNWQIVQTKPAPKAARGDFETLRAQEIDRITREAEGLAAHLNRLRQAKDEHAFKTEQNLYDKGQP